MGKPTYQDQANLFDDSLTALAASDAGLGSDFEAHFCGYERGAAAVTEELNRLGICGGDLDAVAILPKEIRMVYGPLSPGPLMEVYTLRRLGVLESTRLRTLRGLTKPLCRQNSFSVYPNGSVIQGRQVLWAGEGRVWVPVDRRGYTRTGKTFRVNDRIRGEWKDYEELKSAEAPVPGVAAVTEWASRCLWAIRISAPGAPALLASTDPTGVKELLRMRDVPDGRSRREALKHWVREHWRQNRKDEELEHRVREHLRGSELCTWFGLECRILPSPLDIAKVGLGKLRGKIWRRRQVR